jgi:hypothetical protein
VKKVCLVISCNAFCATVEGGFIPETRYRQTERHNHGLTGKRGYNEPLLSANHIQLAPDRLDPKDA